MFVSTPWKRFIFIFFFLIFIFLLLSIFLYPLYTSNEVIVEYGFKPFNICTKYSEFWKNIKIAYIFISLISYLILLNFLYSFFFSKNQNSSNKSQFITNLDELHLLIGNDKNGNKIYLPEKGLYQNILITGTIGTGKTSSAIYPFTNQLIQYKWYNNSKKLGLLILDVKGNYHSKVLEYAKKYNRLEDVIVIELGGRYTYNPLDKPN